MVLYRSTCRAEAFAERALARAPRCGFVRPFAVVGHLSGDPTADVELHSSSPVAVLEDLRLSVDHAFARATFTQGVILYQASATRETLLVADVLEPGRRWLLRFAARASRLELLGAVRSTDWP